MYLESTLDQFKSSLQITLDGGKGSITICYRSLSPANRREARRLVRDALDREGSLARAAKMRLDIGGMHRHMDQAARLGELLDRFATIREGGE